MSRAGITSSAPRGDGVAIPHEPAPSVTLYVCALLASVSALLAAAVGLDFSEPVYTSFTIGLVVIGIGVSFVSRRWPGGGTYAIEIPAAAAFTVICALAFSGGYRLPFIAPEGIAGDAQRSLAVFMSWMVVVLSFVHSSSGRLLFSLVPGLAIMGIVGTVYSDTVLLVLYLVFMSAATVMVIEEVHLRASQRVGVQGTHRAVSHLQVAGLCCVAAMVVARVIAEPLHTIGSLFVLPGMSASTARSLDSPGASTTLRVSENDEVRVATGPVSSTDRMVMRVRAEHGAYWRGATFDEYTGSGWRNGFRARTVLEPVRSRNDRGGVFDPRSPQAEITLNIPVTALSSIDAKSHTLRQVVRYEPGVQFTEMYGAAEPRAIRFYDASYLAGMPVGAELDGSGRIHLARMVSASQYEMESQIADYDPDDLRRIRERAPDDILLRYTALDRMRPDAMERVKAFATSATRGTTNSYDRTVALKSAIGRQCKYNTAASAVPEGEDVVDHFLQSKKEGYCDSFATSLAVLCRSIGIPARVASGFTSGEYDAQDQSYLVRDRDKHQWTEVYFPRYGWLPFDATEDAEDISPRDDDQASRRSPLLGMLFRRGVLPPLALLAFLCLVAYVLKVEVLDRQRRRRIAPQMHDALGDVALRMVGAYTRSCRALSRRGLPRSRGETPREYAARISDIVGQSSPLAGAFVELSDLFSRYRYGATCPTADDLARFKSIADQVSVGSGTIKRRRPAPAPLGSA